jgi:segregation and condensation protein B
MPALETLAVIAYKQPVTVPEINEIRGVHVGGVIKTLLEKRLITTAGRKEVIGRPILYRTSKQFMMRFGLSDLDELPSLKEFEALAQAALGSDEGIAEAEPEESAAIAAEVVDAQVVEVEVVNVEVVAGAGAAVSDDFSDDAASEAGTVPENAKDSISDASGEPEAEFAESPQQSESPATSARDDADKSRAAAASAGSASQSSDSEN